jgi:hypothetical protein
MRIRSRPDPGHFFDGGRPAWLGLPDVPPTPGAPPRIVLDRIWQDGRERFAMLQRVAYRDEVSHTVVLVPARLESFRTDLTSVPAWFTWLVPRSGRHLPAALVHDGLVGGVGEGEPSSYTTDPPRAVDRIEADRIFRDAMRDTGTGVVRRWLVWSAVTAVSLVLAGRPGWGPALRWWYRVAVPATFVVIAWLGTCATAVLLGWDVPGLVSLPWMDEGPPGLRLLGGLVGAVVVPLLLGLLWGRWWRAGAIAGVATATLFHVTVGVAVVAIGYQAVEWAARRAPSVTALVAVLLLALAVTAFPLLVLR